MEPLAGPGTAQSIVRAAFGRIDITPPEGIYHRMWGAATHDRAAGVHQPLTATALLVELEDGPHAIVGLDHCLLGDAELRALTTVVHETTGLPPDRLTVVYSHTHAAGLMLGDRADMPGGELIGGYLDSMNRDVAEMLLAAQSELREAAFSFGVGRCSLARNRDYWDAEREQVVCGFNPHGVSDDTLVVGRVTAEDGTCLGVIVNYACHPTTLAWDNQLVSPDFPGSMREIVESATAAPCLFLQGASGDLGPKEGFTGDVAVAERNGRQLGYAALATLEGLPPPRSAYRYQGAVVSGATIGCWRYDALTPSEVDGLGILRQRRWRVSLPYRPELPSLDEVERLHASWSEKEQAAAAAGNEGDARDAHAMVERQTRLLSRLRTLPPGESYPMEVSVWRTGEALWVMLQGEPYQQLQLALRDRFPGRPVVVAALSGEWGPSYLPPREAFGRGIYQESIAVLSEGSLEQLIEEIAQQLEELAPEYATSP